MRTQCFLSTSSSASHFLVRKGCFWLIISPSKNVVNVGYSSVRPLILRYPQRYEFSKSTCWKIARIYPFNHKNYEAKFILEYKIHFSGKYFTCNITSTSYWLPFDFWCPLNFEPLYNKDLETPGCFDFAGGGGGGTTSMGGQVTRTGIVPRTSKYHSIKTGSWICNASKTILIKLEYSPNHVEWI